MHWTKKTWFYFCKNFFFLNCCSKINTFICELQILYLLRQFFERTVVDFIIFVGFQYLYIFKRSVQQRTTKYFTWHLSVSHLTVNLVVIIIFNLNIKWIFVVIWRFRWISIFYFHFFAFIMKVKYFFIIYSWLILTW